MHNLGWKLIGISLLIMGIIDANPLWFIAAASFLALGKYLD